MKSARMCRLLAAAVAAVPATLSAQAAVRTVSFGVQGGFTVPTGEYADAGESGWNVGGFLQWRPVNQVFGVRGELQYHRNDIKDSFLPVGSSGNFGVTYLGVAPVLEVAPAGSGIGWYLLAGVGMYRFSTSYSESDISVSTDETEIGFNGGAGLRFRFGSANLFAEMRYHGVHVSDPDAGSSNITFMPFSIGISF
jgi:opacity protein-like surface antigen